MTARRIFIRNLVLQARIGIYAHEETTAQRVRISVALDTPDMPDAPDTLASTIDYEFLANAIRAAVSEGHVRLVETLAGRVAAICLADKRVSRARVRIEKLDVFPDAESAGVEIDRSR